MRASREPSHDAAAGAGAGACAGDGRRAATSGGDGRASGADDERRTLEEKARSLKKATTSGARKRSVAELREEETATRERLWKLQSELSNKSNTVGAEKPLTEAEADRVVKDYRNALKEYKKRRSTCLELLGNLSEGMGKNVKDIMEDWGLDGDEEAGVKPSSFPLLPQPARKPLGAKNKA